MSDSERFGLVRDDVVNWCLQYDRLMVRVNAACDDPHQMHILEQEAPALTQVGWDRFALQGSAETGTRWTDRQLNGACSTAGSWSGWTPLVATHDKCAYSSRKQKHFHKLGGISSGGPRHADGSVRCLWFRRARSRSMAAHNKCSRRKNIT